MINMVDIVPYVAPDYMGFKRYGVDRYVPGSSAGSTTKSTRDAPGAGTGGPKAVTAYADNQPYLTKTTAYNSQKTAMLEQLLALNPSFRFNDYFQPKALDFISWGVIKGQIQIYDADVYAGNHVEDFVWDFFWLAQQEAVETRDMWARDPYKLGDKTYPTYQTSIQDLTSLLMDPDKDMSGFMSKVSNIKSKLGYDTLAKLYLNVIGEWDGLDGSDKQDWSNILLNAMTATGALDTLDKTDKAAVKRAFPTLVNFVFKLIDTDYNYKPVKNQSRQWAKGSSGSMMYLITLAQHVDYIISCHMPELNQAWVRTYDSWYAKDYEKSNYALTQPASVAAPKAFGTVDGKPKELTAGEASVLLGDQRIVLDNDAVVGEAVYYDLVDVTDSEKPITIATNQIYRSGIDLALEGAKTKTYKITAYDMSYGIASNSATYNVTLSDTLHKVIVRDLSTSSTGDSTGSGLSGSQLGGQSVSAGQGSTNGPRLMAGVIASGSLVQLQASSSDADYSSYDTHTYTFEEGQKVILKAGVPTANYFKVWLVKVLDKDGNVLSDATTALLPDGTATSMTANFTMPAVDASTYPNGYQLRLTAQYGTRITQVSAQPSESVGGTTLQDEIPVAFDGGAYSSRYSTSMKSTPSAWSSPRRQRCPKEARSPITRSTRPA